MRPLHIAIAKPDWRIRGGFELVVDRIVDHLRAVGHHVSILAFDVYETDGRPYGRDVSDEARAVAPQFVRYLENVEASQRIDAHAADCLISTQPPSWAASHDRHLALFFHHERPFYDLADVSIAAGMVNPSIHEAASDAVRAIDNYAFDRVKHFLAGSETVADRLALYNGRTWGVGLFHAGPSTDLDESQSPNPHGDLAVCVSRHDFPKRTELFVDALMQTPEIKGVSVGVGGRLGIVKSMAQRLLSGDHPDRQTASDVWLNNPAWIDPSTQPDEARNLFFAGSLSTAELVDTMRRAYCFVAPALLEDYGLTVIEAMRHGKPVIVCTDGGHLCEFVRHGVTGLVVEPTGVAISAALRHLRDSPEMCATMGENARQYAAQYTWTRAFREFEAGLDMVMS